MRLFSASVFFVSEINGERAAKRLVSAYELSTFGYFQQNRLVFNLFDTFLGIFLFD